MNISEIRKLSVKILEHELKEFSLYDFEEIQEDNDIIDICSFFDRYSNKFFEKYFEYDINNAMFTKKDIIFYDLIKSTKSLEPHNFEKICSVICKCLGFNECFATQKVKDEGIDFIAERDNSLINIGYKERIIGQSKHYENDEITIKDIRELSGSALLFSRQEFSSTNRYKEFVVGTFAPINILYITSFFFSKDAMYLCEKANIIPIDIIDVVCILYKGLQEKKIDWFNLHGQIDLAKMNKELEEIKVVS